MAKPRMDLPAFVGKLLQEQDGEVQREGVRVLAQALMETAVTDLVSAERYERTDERTAHRNSSRVNCHSAFPHLRSSKIPHPWLITTMRLVPVGAVGRPSAAYSSRCGCVSASTPTAAFMGLPLLTVPLSSA